MHIKGLLEMMFDKLAGWIDEFISDMEVSICIPHISKLQLLQVVAFLWTACLLRVLLLICRESSYMSRRGEQMKSPLTWNPVLVLPATPTLALLCILHCLQTICTLHAITCQRSVMTKHKHDL